MTLTDLAPMLLLAVAGVGAGIINTIVGSGTLLTFPVLLVLGVPALGANIANTIGLAVGNVSGVLGYREELTGQRNRIVWLGSITVLGAFLGAQLLLWLPAEVFSVLVPVLIALGCILVAIQPLIERRRRENGGEKVREARFATSALTFITGTYGGYFGAAQGVLIVGFLGLLVRDSLQRINAIKNVLQTLAGLTASIVFITRTEVLWHAVVIIAISSMVGAQLGARFGRRLPPTVLRVIIVVVGAASIVVFLLR